MIYASSPLANWRVIFTKLVYYGRMEVVRLDYILLLLCLICSISTYNLFQNEVTYMSDFIQITITILTIVTTITGLILTIYKNAQKTNKKIDDLKIGKFHGQTLCNFLFNKFNTIHNDIGKTSNDKTLTGQHKDLQKLLQKEIETAERRYTEEEKRIRNFNSDQHDMLQTITQFRLFMDSWTRISEDNNKLNLRILQLEQKIAEQIKENENLKNHISALENENRKLKSKIQHISNPQNYRSGDDDREL